MLFYKISFLLLESILQPPIYAAVYIEISIMTVLCFPYITTVCFITLCMLNLVNTNAMEAKSYQTTSSTRALWSKNTIDVDSTSMIECALLCLSNQQCCLTSFCTETSTCRIDTSETCCIDTENVDGWRTFRRNIYRKF